MKCMLVLSMSNGTETNKRPFLEEMTQLMSIMPQILKNKEPKMIITIITQPKSNI